MESILSTNPESTTIEAAHAASMRRFALIFQPANLRPPVLEEMRGDLDRLIAKIAGKYSDASCPELNYDELIQEGNYKLAYVLDKVVFEKCHTRTKFFALFSTALKRHVSSLVQKHRFTEKRTGVKPPKKGESFTGTEHIKTVEIRLDDEEVNLQVASKPCESQREHETAELIEDYASVLNPIEQLVFHQLANPNQVALCSAQVDAAIGRAPGECLQIRIEHRNLAYGLGISEQLFAETVLSVRNKITKHRSMTQDDEKAKRERISALTQLEEIFQLQIPKAYDDMVIRRMLTLAARDQYDKVKNNPNVKELLLIAGAKLPEMHGNVLNCRGVAFQKNNHICNSCGYRVACATEAANFGLGKITISRHLLGAKLTRVPAILPNSEVESDVPEPSDEEMEIVAYLDEGFRKSNRKGQPYYSHKDDGTFRPLFRVNNSGAEFRIQFCNPSDALKTKLYYEQKSYFAPVDASLSEVIALIDVHAKETYVAG